MRVGFSARESRSSVWCSRSRVTLLGLGFPLANHAALLAPFRVCCNPSARDSSRHAYTRQAVGGGAGIPA
jgi:hypothetical protein